MESEARDFYFHLYTQHFGKAVLRDVLASIPSLNCADDHDFFDGIGSYPEYLAQSNVMMNLKRVGFVYYHLFQLQTNYQLAA